MTTELAAENLQRAHSTIREVLDNWDATDLDRVELARQHLVTAVRDLRVFEAAIRHGEVFPTVELRAKLLAASKDIVRATRVVDACVAFHRGLAARTTAMPLGYNAEGRIAGEPAGMEPEVLA